MVDLAQEDVRVSEEGEGGLAAEEKEEETPQKHAGDPSDDVPTSVAEHIRPSFSLREAWPKSLLDEGVLDDGGRGLVVCTIDVQLLNDTVQVMHSQIGMLRQTILDLRQGVETQRAAEAEELEIIRRKIDSLEGAALESGHHEQEGPRLENIDDIMAALRSSDEARVKEGAARAKESAARAEESAALAKESARLEVRLQHLESTIYGEVNDGVLGNEACEEETNPAKPAFVAEPRDSSTKEAEGAPALLEEADRALPEFGGKAGASAVETGAAEGDAKEEGTKGKATKVAHTMKSLAKTIAMVGGMALCPKVNKLQNQVGSILERERAAKLAERVAALESMLAAENGKADNVEVHSGETAAEDQRRKQLVRLLRKAALLRNMLTPGGIVGGGGTDTDAAGSCWTQDGEEGVGGVGEGGSAKQIAGEDAADGEDLLQRLHGRLAWLEVHATETFSSDATVAAASANDTTLSNEQEGSRQGSNEGARAGGTNIGSPALLAKASTTLTSLGDEGAAEEASVGGLAVAPSAEVGHGGDLEGSSAKIYDGDHVERLWRRMDDVERRIYQLAANRVPSPSPAGEVTASDLRELSSSLKSGASALETRLEDGLLSLGSRIDALESNQTESTEVVAGGAADVDIESHIQQMLTNVLKNEIPLVRRNLESVQDRVSVLEATATDKTGVGEPGLSAEEAANAAAEEIQTRLFAEMSALEDRVDRRARDDARRAREEREAAEARGSMRRISSTVSAYTADLAARLEVLQSEHERQGTEVARAAEEITAAEVDLKNMGSELVGLGEIANSVSIVVDGKADQADVEALKLAMQRLDTSVAAKARGATAAARDAEAISALQVALKDMSASMEGSMRKLQQAQASAGTIKIKPILDRVVKELADAGLLPDADAGHGAIGKSMCLSCNRPMTVNGNQTPSRFASQFRGTLGSRMEQVSPFPLQINKPAVVWRGGFKMPPPHSAHQNRHRSRRPESATSLGKKHPPLAGAGVGGAGLSSQGSTSDSRWNGEAGLTGNTAHDRLPGIPNILDSGGGEGGVDGGGGRRRGKKVVVGSLRTSTEAPHRGRFVQTNNASIVGPHVVASLNGRKA